GAGVYFGLSDNGNSSNSANGGSPGGSSSKTSAGAAPASLGDLKTVDPCGFFTAPSFAAQSENSKDTGQLKVQIEPSSFSGCSIGVYLANDAGMVDITSTIATGADLSKINTTTYDITTKGQFKIVEAKKQADQRCDEVLVLPDNNVLAITAKPRNQNAAKANFCGLADIAVSDAIAAISQGPKHLAAFPASSAGRLDACSLLSTSAAATALGESSVASQPGAGNHSCGYGESTSAGTPVIVGTTLMDLPVKADSGLGITESTVAGRDTFISSTAGDTGSLSSCEVETAVRDWKPWTGSINEFQDLAAQPAPSKEIIEYEVVIVHVSGSADQACGAAKQLASTVWPELPAAS
ncbi:MAG TPA: hypothetical protein VF388_08975, partial [Lacunisphaera sp.]